MDKEQAIATLENMKYELSNQVASKYCRAKYEAIEMAIKALEMVEEFEKAQIITGGRLNGRTYAYKCGLEDGKRKALEQQSDDCISRQAIINNIDSIREHHGGILDVRLVATQLPPVTPIIPTSNDCIARQPLIDNWNSCADMLMDEGDSAIVMDWIFDAPPVTPTHKVGKWINKTHKSGCGISFVASECTCCGKKTLFNCDELLYNYCPNCGAEMEGGKDE